jgi:hypothetical protein
MCRVIVFSGILSIISLIIYLIVDRLGYKFQLGSFINGVVTAGITGFLFFQLIDWWSRVCNPSKSVSAVVKTNQVPLKMVLAGLFELARGIIITIVVIALAAFLIFKLAFG